MAEKSRSAQVERVGFWTIDKLDDLESYMGTYAGIMNVLRERRRWPGRFFYIDAFAGPGLVAMKEDDAEDQEAVNYLMGSPLRALTCKPPFDFLWFIDKNPERRDSLTQIISEQQAEHRAKVEIGDCNKLLGGIVSRITPQERALAFLDPYGLQLEWDTVKQLAATKKLDVFINFSIMGIFRNLPKNGRPSQAVHEKLDRVMASASWFDQLYNDQWDLDGGVHSSRKALDPRKLAAIYASDLATLFRYVSEPIIMWNRKNGPLYALVLASHAELAVQRMNQIIHRHAKRKAAATAQAPIDSLPLFSGSSVRE